MFDCWQKLNQRRATTNDNGMTVMRWHFPNPFVRATGIDRDIAKQRAVIGIAEDFDLHN
jgi:hypothetical protein